MPVAGLDEEARAAVEKLLEGFAKEGEDAEGELVSFAQRYNKVLDIPSKRTEVQQGKRVIQQVAPSSDRANFYNNGMREKVPAVTRAVNVLLSMPVTACAAERNWSRWGLTYLPNRGRLGLGAAQKLIFVQQNDPATRNVM